MVKKIVLWVLCILWAIMIFMFSAQPASDSNKVSLGFTENIIMFIIKLDIIDIPVSSYGLEETVVQFAKNINTIIRKIAHFSVYLVFGILVLNLTKCYFKSKKALLITLLTCFLYAVSDEVHQIFVPGRAGMFKDVMIDFCGTITGVVLFCLIKNIKKRRT